MSWAPYYLYKMGGDHLVLNVDRFVNPEMSSSGSGERPPPSEVVVGPSSASSSSSALDDEGMMEEANDEEAPLITLAECRICQDEDAIGNMDTPCACRGSLKVTTS